MRAQTIGIGLLSFAHSHGEKWGESLRDDPRVDFVGAGGGHTTGATSRRRIR